MKHFLLAICLLCSNALFAQQPIKPEEAAKHVGDSLTVYGRVHGGVYLDKTTTKLTLLNVGGDYPNAPLTVVVPPGIRASIDSIAGRPLVLENFCKGKMVYFTGRIVLYKDKPQMVLTATQRMGFPRHGE